MTPAPTAGRAAGAPVRPAAGRRPDEVRRHNLSAVLRRVHLSGPVSRAELGETLALNRSTVGSLAAELAAAGLVREQPPVVTTSVGRPSLVLAPQAQAVHVLVCEVTTDCVRVARVGLGGQVLDRCDADHAEGQRGLAAVVDGLARLAETVEGRAEGSRCVGVGAAVPGMVRAADGLVRVAPNLEWVEEPFGACLAQRLGLGLPVAVGNDADLGARAEHVRGVAVGSTDLVYLSGQVGLGGGIISSGRELTGVHGYAGEVGHVPINPAGRSCRCGSSGCWETEVNEDALLRGAPPGAPRRGVAGVQAVVDAAAAGDALARQTLDQVGHWLGVGVAGLLNLLNPQTVVFGGHLAVVLPAVRTVVEERVAAAALAPHREAVRLVLPALGADSTLLGAAELAFAPLLADPTGLLAAVPA